MGSFLSTESQSPEQDSASFFPSQVVDPARAGVVYLVMRGQGCQEERKHHEVIVDLAGQSTAHELWCGVSIPPFPPLQAASYAPLSPRSPELMVILSPAVFMSPSLPRTPHRFHPPSHCSSPSLPPAACGCT